MANSQSFPNRKPSLIFKIYIGLFGFVLVGLIPILLATLNHGLNQYITNNPGLAHLVLIGGAVWGLALISLLPLGIILLGIWSVIYKESAIRSGFNKITYSAPIKLSGNSAVLAGYFYIVLGLVLLWGEVGVLLGFFCTTSSCLNLPHFIKFF